MAKKRRVAKTKASPIIKTYKVRVEKAVGPDLLADSLRPAKVNGDAISFRLDCFGDCTLICDKSNVAKVASSKIDFYQVAIAMAPLLQYMAICEMRASGKLLILESDRELLDADTGPNIDVVIGKSIQRRPPRKGKWHRVQRAEIDLPTGRLCVLHPRAGTKTNCEHCIEVPPGFYDASIFFRDLQSPFKRAKSGLPPDIAIYLKSSKKTGPSWDGDPPLLTSDSRQLLSLSEYEETVGASLRRDEELLAENGAILVDGSLEGTTRTTRLPIKKDAYQEFGIKPHMTLKLTLADGTEELEMIVFILKPDDHHMGEGKKCEAVTAVVTPTFARFDPDSTFLPLNIQDYDLEQRMLDRDFDTNEVRSFRLEKITLAGIKRFSSEQN